MKTAKKQDFVKKQQTLESTKLTLKTEFFGIDSIIDNLVDSIKGWYLFPQYQERPVVVNLWGMTGVGKTQLLQRLSELLNFKEQFYNFDMQKAEDRSGGIQSNLEDLYDYQNGKPAMLVFDEFQHLKAYDEKGFSLSNDLSQIVWKLVDSGKFQFFSFNRSADEVIDFYYNLQSCVDSGLRGKNGAITKGVDSFRKTIGIDYTDDDFFKLPLLRNATNNHWDEREEEKNKQRPVRLVPVHILKSLVDELGGLRRRKTSSHLAIEEKFNGYDHNETLAKLKTMIEEMLAPKIMDCSKSVIFICGNLDSVYPMAGEFNPDIEADFLYKQSKKITLSDVKEGLSKFLRYEQISRLGSTHLIYPSLSKKAYQQIIKQQLNKFHKKVLQEENIEVTFDESVFDLLYEEGVFPSQGARPLLSSLNQLLFSKWGEVMGEIILQKWRAVSKIHWSFDGENYAIKYNSQTKIKGTKKLPVARPLYELRHQNSGEKRVIVAVHEAGHALAYRVLMKRSPEYVLSSTAGNNAGGFMLNDDDFMLSKHLGIKRLAIYLAGYCAERQVFGVDSITHGASDDLFKAKMMASTMIGSLDFHRYKHSSVYEETVLRKPQPSQQYEVNELLEEAFAIADDILKKYNFLHKALTEYLIEQRTMDEEQMEAIVSKISPELEINLKKKTGEGYYMNQFKKSWKATETKRRNSEVEVRDDQ